MIVYTDSLKLIFKHKYSLGKINIPISYSVKKVSFNDIVSNINVPEFNNSAMDGFLLKYSDFFFFF